MPPETSTETSTDKTHTQNLSASPLKVVKKVTDESLPPPPPPEDDDDDDTPPPPPPEDDDDTPPPPPPEDDNDESLPPPPPPEDGDDDNELPTLRPMAPNSKSSRKPIWNVVKPTSRNKTTEMQSSEAKSALDKSAQKSQRVDVKKLSPLQATPVKKVTGGSSSMSPHLPPERPAHKPPERSLPPPPNSPAPKPPELSYGKTTEDIPDNIIEKDGEGCPLSQLNSVEKLKGIAKRKKLESKTVRLSIAALKKILQENDNINNPYNVITNLGFCINDSDSGKEANMSAKFNGEEEEVKNWLAAIILLDKYREDIAKSKSLRIILKVYFKTTKKALQARRRLFPKKNNS